MTLEVGLDPPEDDLIAVGVAPAQIAIDHVAGEIVREQPFRSGLDEGEVAEPVEQLADIGSVERRAQQGLGGDPGQGAGLQRLPLVERGDAAEKPLNQRGHQVGRVGGQVNAAVPDGLVGQQRQAERMAVADLQQSPVHCLGHTAAAKVLPTFLRRQVTQADDPEQFPPGRIGSPAGSGRLPAGEHGHHIGGEIRQQLLPDPVVQSREPFVGVQQNDRPSGPVTTVAEGLTQCRVDSPSHPFRRGQEIPRIHPDEPPLLPAGGHSEGVEQR